jgi:lipopolysaccharide/colanic/teichoic acid biosynthesis glycosyltransferase
MIKRLFDISISGLVFIVLLPVMLITAFMVAIFLGCPVFFCQRRPGYLGKPFNIYKFRTMNDRRDLNGNLLADNERLTWFGKWLRSTSADELPTLWNVLSGNMSLVGPRPLLMEYLPLYSKEQARRHLVKPGVTGWSQVNGRNAISWSDKFYLDVWYVDNQSFFLDLKILFLTIQKVFIREGINAEGEATMAKFTGNSR